MMVPTAADGAQATYPALFNAHPDPLLQFTGLAGDTEAPLALTRNFLVHRATDTATDPVTAEVAEMVAAANHIATLPYIYGGGHGSFVAAGYDCSGSVSYVLHAAGLLSRPEDSSQLESYGVPGPGRYVTIYADAGHAWMTIDGRRFDTIALQETGNRWSDEMTSTAGYVAVHPAGL